MELHDRFLACVEKATASEAIAHFATIACRGSPLLSVRRRQLLVMLCDRGMVREASDLLTSATLCEGFEGQDLATTVSWERRRRSHVVGEDPRERRSLEFDFHPAPITFHDCRGGGGCVRRYSVICCRLAAPPNGFLPAAPCSGRSVRGSRPGASRRCWPRIPTRLVGSASETLTRGSDAVEVLFDCDVGGQAAFMYVIPACLREGEIDRAVDHFRQASERRVALDLPLCETLAGYLFLEGLGGRDGKGAAWETVAWDVLEYVRQRGMHHGTDVVSGYCCWEPTASSAPVVPKL